MGMGANQSYNGMYGINPFAQLLSKVQPAPEPVQPSMVADMIARAKAAESNVNVPTMEQLMPYLSSLYAGQQQPIATNQSYGAGRFLSPAQGQSTGGVLGFNFNAPSK